VNNKYYAINFILHIVYGCVNWNSLAYGLAHAGYLGGWMLLIFSIPVPIITNVLCIRACYRNTKKIREFFKCLGLAILAGYLSTFIAVALFGDYW
jgi:hypothetical protein